MPKALPQGILTKKIFDQHCSLLANVNANIFTLVKKYQLQIFRYVVSPPKQCFNASSKTIFEQKFASMG
jgi:hypothetical protein